MKLAQEGYSAGWETSILPSTVYWESQGFPKRIPAFQRYDHFSDPDISVAYFINPNVELLLALEHIFTIEGLYRKILLQFIFRTAFFWLESQTDRPQVIRLTTLGPEDARAVLYRDQACSLKGCQEKPEVKVEVPQIYTDRNYLHTCTILQFPGEYPRRLNEQYRLEKGDLVHQMSGSF